MVMLVKMILTIGVLVLMARVEKAMGECSVWSMNEEVKKGDTLNTQPGLPERHCGWVELKRQGIGQRHSHAQIV